MPEPTPRPCHVVGRNSLIGVVDGVYAEVLPEVGHVVRGVGGYDHVRGRFRSANRAEAERTAHEIVSAYRLMGEPVA